MKNKLLKYLLAGLAYLLPIGVLVFVLYKIFIYIDKFARYIIPDDLEFPGLGVVVLVVLVTLFGWFTTVSKLDDYARELFLGILNRIPILKNIYSSLEDLTSALTGQKKAFDKPVLVKISKDSEIERIGFIASDDLEFLGIEEGKVAVAMPFTFSYMSKIIIVPAKNVTPINAKSSEVMKWVVSGGIADDHHHHPKRQALPDDLDDLLD